MSIDTKNFGETTDDLLVSLRTVKLLGAVVSVRGSEDRQRFNRLLCEALEEKFFEAAEREHRSRTWANTKLAEVAAEVEQDRMNFNHARN